MYKNQTYVTGRPLENQCKYPIVALITDDVYHCWGALVLYGSVVRSVITEQVPPTSVCMNFMYINESMSLITMKKWGKKANPFHHNVHCRNLLNFELNSIVPLNWYPISKLTLPQWMALDVARWSTVMNKINLWAFDIFDRIFILDIDIVILREVTKIMDETPMIYDIAGGIDGWYGCDDRSKLNGGVVLIKGGAYVHAVALQMLNDKKSSCLSGRWGEGEQELLNCICGFMGRYPQRPEFRCQLLPVFDHAFPRSYKCPDAAARPLRMVHFAGGDKPWHKVANETKEPDRLYWWCIKEAMSTSQISRSILTRKSTVHALLACNLPSVEM